MARKSGIEYCDTTINAAMGCTGCELWIPRKGIKDCFAGNMVTRYAGLPGFPEAFDKPTLFEERIQKAIRLPDLTGECRDDKPWLDESPRMIFLNDLGETFDPLLPLDWLKIHLDDIHESPHIWLVLTKQAIRMRKFFNSLNPDSAPPNLWIGVSVTSQETVPRLRSLAETSARGVKWVSFEPLLGPIALPGKIDFQWAIIGGGSAMKRRTKRAWILDLYNQLKDRGVSVFFKQYGNLWENPFKLDKTAKENGGVTHGGCMLFRDTYVREMPNWENYYD